MNYAAINAKVGGMGTRALTKKEAVSSICLYIPDKDLRNYVKAHMGSGINYYLTRWKVLARLGRANRQALRGILGAEIDLTNIIWMYRLKRYRGIRGDSTYGYLIPIRYRLSRAATQRMAECENTKALLEEISKSPYARDIDFSDKKATPEQQLISVINKRYKNAARRHPNTLVPVLAYLYGRQAQGLSI